MQAFRAYRGRLRPLEWPVQNWRPKPGAALFGVVLAGYLLVAGLSVLGLHVMPADSLSRVGIAQRVIFSRDPHLAAIGFVWNPLQTVPLIPLIPLKLLWSDFVVSGFAASVVSVVFMAGAVYQVHGTLKDFGVSRIPRVLLTIMFALHPMILYYAVNGMSEAILLFFLLVAVRQLAAWLRTSETPRLAYAGLALAGAYFSRYEALGPGAAATLLVALASFIHSRGELRDRIATSMSDSVIIATPLVAAFGFWALTGWIIVGHPFEPLTSPYGNAVHLQVAQQQGVSGALEYARGWLPALTLTFQRMLVLEPFALTLLAVALVQIVLRRGKQLLAPLALFSAVLIFILAAYLRGAIFGDLRYFIAVIPLTTLVIGALMPSRGWDRTAMVGTVLLLGTAVSAVPVAAIGLTNPTLAPSQSDELMPVVDLVRHPLTRAASEPRNLTERDVAQAVDALHPGSGSVLVDVFVGYPIVLYSSDPSQFVIPSDRDWRVALSDPAADGVTYFLVPSPYSPLAALDDLNRTYPGIFQDGAGMGRLVRTFASRGASGSWRLFRVTHQAGAGST